MLTLSSALHDLLLKVFKNRKHQHIFHLYTVFLKYMFRVPFINVWNPSFAVKVFQEFVLPKDLNNGDDSFKYLEDS